MTLMVTYMDMWPFLLATILSHPVEDICYEEAMILFIYFCKEMS